MRISIARSWLRRWASKRGWRPGAAGTPKFKMGDRVKVKSEASPYRDLTGVIKLIIPLENSFAYGVEFDSKYAVVAEEDLEAISGP